MDEQLKETQRMIEKGHDERIIGCTCVLWYGDVDVSEEVGTGSLVTIAQRNFILTCEHVASDFMAKPIEAFSLPSKRIPKAGMRLAAISKSLDIALIEVPKLQIAGIRPLTPEVFQFHPSMVPFDTRKKNFIFSGWPGELVRAKMKERSFEMFKMCTTGAQKKQAHKTRFLIDYPKTLLSLPNPHGMSGSLMVEVPERNAFVGKIATYQKFPVVGLVMAWDRKRKQTITCTAVWPLKGWIEQIQKGFI